MMRQLQVIHGVSKIRLCEVEGCGGKHKAKGLCRKHYYAANKEFVIAQVRAYQDANREKVRASQQRYRATERGKVMRSKVINGMYDNPGFLRGKTATTAECSYVGAHKRVMSYFGRATDWSCVCGLPAEQWAWTQEINEYTRYEIKPNWEGIETSIPIVYVHTTMLLYANPVM